MYFIIIINRHASTKAMVFKLGELVNLNEYSHCVEEKLVIRLLVG